MNTQELPMILFTVIAQMCVGAFVGLGLIQLVARTRFKQKTIDQVTDPVLYAIGPALVVGLAVSMLHMNDIFHTLNVFRHWETSWLSREIIFGIAFAAVGFLFAAMQGFKWGSGTLRMLVAGLGALLGLGLLWSMSMIYASLPMVPAWGTWIVPFQFFGSATILGSLAICSSLLITDAVRKGKAVEVIAESRAEVERMPTGGIATLVKTRVKEINAPTTEPEWRLTTHAVQALSFIAATAGLAVLVSYSIHLSNLAVAGPAGEASAEAFAGGFFITRLVLLGVAAILLAFLSFRIAATATQKSTRLLAIVVTAAFILAFVAELMGRSLHYDSMVRLGI